MSEPAGVDDNCYMFTTDGFIVKKDNNSSKTPVATWVSEEDTGCMTTIVSGEETIEIISETEESCISAVYNDVDILLCSCEM